MAFAWLLASHVNACILAVSSWRWAGRALPLHPGTYAKPNQSVKRLVIRQITFVNVGVHPEAEHCVCVLVVVADCGGTGNIGAFWGFLIIIKGVDRR